MTAHTPYHYHHPDQPPTRYAPVGFAPGDRVLFLGDNSTAAPGGYVDILAQALARTRPDLDLHLLNAGREGDTTRSAEARLAADMLAHDPDWVAILLGLNDLNESLGGSARGVPLPEFQERYPRLVAAIQAAGSKVILLTTSVIGENLNSRPNRLLKAYNIFIRELAARETLPLVDVSRAFQNAYDRAATYKQEVTLTTSNGTQPNLQGHALIARTFMTELGLLNR